MEPKHREKVLPLTEGVNVVTPPGSPNESRILNISSLEQFTTDDTFEVMTTKEMEKSSGAFIEDMKSSSLKDDLTDATPLITNPSGTYFLSCLPKRCTIFSLS
jgi:hypothetical protein